MAALAEYHPGRHTVVAVDSAERRQIIVEGLAAHAVALAEMGADEADVHARLIAELHRLSVADPVAVLREAAAAVTAGPQPLDETADELERARPIRELLGVTDPAQQLAATLRAREWVQRLADELDTA